MNATQQGDVARAIGDALKLSGYVAGRTVYDGNRLDRCYEPGPHELLAILVAAGVNFYRVEGTVTSDPAQLQLVPDKGASDE